LRYAFILAVFAERVAHPPPRPVDAEGDRGDRREGEQRHAPVERHHHRDDDGEAEEIAERVERAGREHLADRVHVVRHARDEPADRRAIEEPEAAGVQEAEDAHAQVGHRARAGELHQVELREGERLLQDHDAREQQAAAREVIEPAGRVEGVERVTHDERAQQRQQRRDDEQRQRQREVRALRAHERPQPQQHARVVRLAEP